MNHLLLSLFRVGQLVQESKSTPLGSTILKEYYLCEVTNESISFQKGETPIGAHHRVVKGSGRKCNTFDENLIFLMGLRDGIEGAFWEKCLHALESAEAIEARNAVRCFRDRLKGYFATKVCTKGTKTFYEVCTLGSPIPETRDVNEKTPGVVIGSMPIVLTYKGTPLFNLPEVQRMLTQRSTSSGAPNGFDLLTGKPCVIAETHDKVGGEVDSPLISFNNKAYQVGNLKQGFNFPVSDETQILYSTGMAWVAQENSSLFHEGLSKLMVGWWAEGTLEHPFHKLLRSFLKSPERGILEKDWEKLRHLQFDNRPIHFLVWRSAMSRFAVVEELEIPANQLQCNLLRYHREWGSIGYDSIRTVLTKSEIEGMTPIPLPYLVPTLKAILTGTPYPDAVYSSYTKQSYRWANPNRWIEAYLSRKFNMSLTDNPSKVEYSLDDEVPALESYMNLDNLSAEQRAAYQYGVNLFLAAKLKQAYHLRNGSNNSVRTMDLLAKHQKSPMKFYSGELVSLSVYLEWALQYGGFVTRIVLGYFNKIHSEIKVQDLVNINGQLSAYVGLGWVKAIAYCSELSSYRRQLTNLLKAEGKVEKAKEFADDEEVLSQI